MAKIQRAPEAPQAPRMGQKVFREVRMNDWPRQELLQAAFKLICNPDDWKAPIDCIVPFNDASFFHDAIVSITGTVPKSERAPDGHNFRLTSVGYRAGPCGDH